MIDHESAEWRTYAKLILQAGEVRGEIQPRLHEELRTAAAAIGKSLDVGTDVSDLCKFQELEGATCPDPVPPYLIS